MNSWVTAEEYREKVERRDKGEALLDGLGELEEEIQNLIDGYKTIMEGEVHDTAMFYKGWIEGLEWIQSKLF